jgi:hypothetical protein
MEISCFFINLLVFIWGNFIESLFIREIICKTIRTEKPLTIVMYTCSYQSYLVLEKIYIKYACYMYGYQWNVLNLGYFTCTIDIILYINKLLLPRRWKIENTQQHTTENGYQYMYLHSTLKQKFYNDRDIHKKHWPIPLFQEKMQIRWNLRHNFNFSANFTI